MKTLTDLLHRIAILTEELAEERARTEELYERLRTLDNAFAAYRGSDRHIIERHINERTP